MKTVDAEITWISAENGGRRNPIPIGPWYAPHIRLTPDISELPWSIKLYVVKEISSTISQIRFELLADSIEAIEFQEKLIGGRRFWLYEGMRTVAEGVVL